MKSRKIHIVDSTLRDGEQAPGSVMSVNEKVTWASRLASIGVQDVEAITPAMGEFETEAFRRISGMHPDLRLYCWNRLKEEDVERSIQIGAKHVFISSPVSKRQYEGLFKTTPDRLLAKFQELASFAAFEGVEVICGFMDFHYADEGFIRELALSVEEAGASRVRISDTTGCMTPVEVFGAVKNIRNFSNIALEFHGHNDFGMAGANALSAAQAGADYIDATILGVGERAGNTRLEELVLSLEKLGGYKTGIDTRKMARMSLDFAESYEIDIELNRPILGQKIFHHESGIHVNGVAKDPSFYEPYDPDLVGNARQIVLGKHSGRKSLIHFCQKYGINAEGIDLDAVLVSVREKSMKLKRSLNDIEVKKILEPFLSVPSGPSC